MKRPEARGSVTVIAALLVIVAAVMMLGVARVGLASMLRTRAENAADAAALAAADQLALGHNADDARTAADATARENGALLVECHCEGRSAEVVVRLIATVPIPGFPEIEGRARAEVSDP